MLAADPSPTLDKNLASTGPGILSSIGVGVWTKAPEAFPDSNTTLDTLQSASFCTKNSLARRNRVVMGEHWTGSPNKRIGKIGKNCPKNVFSAPADTFQTF